MKRFKALFIMLLACACSYAQNTYLERAYVHTDKDCYVAGEDILIKFYIVDTGFRPSTLSKVGYVEIADTEKPQVQAMIALENGRGGGSIKIPPTLPTGTYQLTAYTRYMRNEGEDTFFKRTISIVNVAFHTENNRLKLLNEGETLSKPMRRKTNIQVASDKQSYSNRSVVRVGLNRLPADVSDLVISVSKNDSTVSSMSPVNHDQWQQQVSTPGSTPLHSWSWEPEYEGHILTGQTVSTSKEAQILDYTKMTADIGLMSKDPKYIRGKMKGNSGQAVFYTRNIVGPQEVVITTLSIDEDKTYRMDIQSPYSHVLPKQLPLLEVMPAGKQLMERSIGAQLRAMITPPDSLNSENPLKSYYNLGSHLSYDLDEYTRFNTMRETFTEFVRRIHIRRVEGKQKLKVMLEEEKRFNAGNTLVLLDGIPIHDHEDIINCNPRLIKSIDIYSGRYTFGGEVFECMVVFNSHRGDFPGIQLTDRSLMITYDFPHSYTPLDFPIYETDLQRSSRKPDFRHTLFWEPFAEKLNDLASGITFYTSDLCGEFKVVVEGITATGEAVYGETTFVVEP